MKIGTHGFRERITPRVYAIIRDSTSTYAKPGFDEAAVQPSIPGSDWRAVGGVITNQYVLTTTLTTSALAQVFTKYPTLVYLGQTSRLFHELRLSEITPRSQAEVAALGFEAGITVIGQATWSRMALSSVEGCRTTLTAEACDGMAFDGQGGNWHIAESKIDKAWQLLGSTGSSDIYIGVLDGGFYFDHKDLKWLKEANPARVRFGLIGRDLSENHGTGVLGVLGAEIGNNLGITGINGAAIFVTSALPVSGRTTETLSQLDNVAMFNKKVRLTNNSWGPSISTQDYESSRLKAIEGLLQSGAFYREPESVTTNSSADFQS